MEPFTPITTIEQLEAFGTPMPRVRDKVLATLEDVHREWIAATTLVFVATASAGGQCDVSPRDPPGFIRVLSPTRLAVPERPGNRRMDGLRNILENPHAGLNCLIPGRGDTLRVNGRAQLVTDLPDFDTMVVKGHRPSLTLILEVEEVFFHCPKAFRRSGTWAPQTWQPTSARPYADTALALWRKDQPEDEVRRHYANTVRTNISIPSTIDQTEVLLGPGARPRLTGRAERVWRSMLKNESYGTQVNQTVGGVWSGLGMVPLWAPMILVIPLFPDLDDRTEVVAFWRDHGSITLYTMALVVAGYPLLLLFFPDVAARSARDHDHPVLSWAALAAGVMFMTGLCAALGLAAVAGQIIEEGGTDLSAAYGLHVGSFVLAAPFTGAGVAFFVFLALLAHRGHLQPRWLRWPALLGIAGNFGAIGGLFNLTGPGNSGNGILAGILFPLRTFLLWTVCASTAWLRAGATTSAPSDSRALS